MSLGAGEILLLAILALLLFGPQRLPEVGRQVGRALAEIRRVSRDFEREVQDVTEPFKRELREASEPFAREVKDLETEARRAYDMNDDFSSFATEDDEKPSSEQNDDESSREH